MAAEIFCPPLGSLTIRHILTHDVLTVSPDLSLAEAAALMAEKRISCLVATEQKKPVGILTEADLVHIGHLHVDMRQTTVERYLSPPVISNATDQSIYEALDFLLEHRAHHLVVVDGDGCLQGILTFSNILKAAEFDDFLVTKPIADVMSRNVVTLEPSDGVERALAMMDERHISCVVVVDEHGKAVGIFSERDAARLLAAGEDVSSLSMRDVMSTPLITMHEDESLLEASQLMRRHRLRRMVIVDDADKPIGILTQFDVIHGLEGKRIQELRKHYGEAKAALNETRKLLAEKAEMERIVDISPAVLYRLEWREGEPLPKAYHDAPWAGYAGGCFVPTFVSASIRQVLGFEPGDCLHKDWWIEHVHPDDRPSVLRNMGRLFRDGWLRHSYRVISASGKPVVVEDQLRLSRDEDGRPVEAVGSWMEITERKQAEAFEADQRKILEMIANSEVSLSEVLEEIVRTAQRQRPGMLGSVLLLDADGRHLRHGAAPDLPQAYSDAIDGGEIGPNAGSCGTAAFTGERVIVSDIATDPLWADYKELAASFGLAACWSEPIISHGKVLGTFALYYPEPKEPDAGDIKIIERLAALAGTAIRHKRAEQAIRVSEAKYRSLFEESRDMMHMVGTDERIMDVNRAELETLGYTREEMIGKSLEELVCPKYHAITMSNFAALMQGQSIPVYETAMQAKDGSCIDVEVTATPQFDEDGNVIASRAIVRDIRLRKQKEALLARRERQLAVLAEAGLRLNEQLDELEIGRKLVQLACRLVDCKSGAVGFFHDDKICFREYLKQGERMDIELDFPAGYGVPGHVLETKAPYISADAPNDPHVIPEIQQALGFVTLIDVPILDAAGELLGCFEMHDRNDGADFDVQDLEMLQSLAGIVAAALVNARQQLEIRQAAERMRTVLDADFDAIVVHQDFKVVFGNKQACKLFGYGSLEEALGEDSLQAFVPEQRELARRVGQQVLRTGKPTDRIEMLGVRRNGETFPMEIASSRIQWQGEAALMFVVRDITERKQAEEKLAHLSYYDELTELPNRRLFHDRTKQAIALATREQASLALIYLDLDRFKFINDTLGHTSGDAVLKEAGGRFDEVLRASDTAARMGGDEFAVLLQGVDANMAMHVAGKIRNALRQPFRLGDQDFTLDVSIGIAIFPQDGEDAETLLKHADAAMYHAKSSHKHIHYFSTGMEEMAARRLRMEQALARAADERQLQLHYQGKHRLDGGIIGVESLVRWLHPELGMVSPTEFIPLAEESGMIRPITQWVLAEAARQAHAWEEAGIWPGRIGVNISAIQLMQKGLAQDILECIKDAGASPEWFEIEITETAAMREPETAIHIMRELTEAGFSIAIDDFGTGYSSLAYLKRLPVEWLKIDIAFIRGLPDDEEDAAIVRSIIAMAHALGMKTIAEGVETEAQLAFLKNEGCDAVQGYLLSKPLPADEASDYLHRCRGEGETQ